MKEKILNLLVANQGEFVSGEDLSKLLGVSRAAIWKHINKLKEEGYRIESQTKLGHRLAELNGPLNKYQLSRNLGTTEIGTEFVVYDTVTSTNDLAKDLARAGAKAGTVVVAGVQTGGRGRRGRQWISPKGGIWMSVILRPGLELKDAAGYTLLAGVAVANAINKATGLKCGIKWPNDILLKGEKVGGILTEVVGEWQTVEFLVMGIGINANLALDELPPGVEATSLSLALGSPVELNRIIQEILREIEHWDQRFRLEGSAPVLAAWRQLAVCLHCPVVVKEFNREWTGESIDICSDGALLVRNGEGREVKLFSGEVSLRGVKDTYTFR